MYSHFGKPADIWKHLALCEVINNENPDVYIETNSACAAYQLSRTPEQEYGIYHFIEQAVNYEELYRSVYFGLEQLAMDTSRYIGSPGLAMSILGRRVERFVFFDIQATPLENIATFATEKGLIKKTTTIQQDSIIGISDQLNTCTESTLIHIDPYAINVASTNGLNYMDIFVKASGKGMKCFLWYGFNTLEEKNQLNDFIINKLSGKTLDNLCCVELIMNIIQKDSILCNPGILGNGLLMSNLSEKSVSTVMKYSELLVDLYKNTSYKGYKGDLYRCVLDLP